MQHNMMGQHIIITEPSSNLRALGRNALKGKWQIAILTVVVMQLCVQIPEVILNAIFGTKANLYGLESEANVDLYSSIYNGLPSVSVLSGIYLIVVSGAFALGVAIFFLALFRRQQVEVVDVFLGFEHFGKALGLLLYQTLFVFLWTLLFIVPGIIASLRYSQAFYILADDPTKGIRQCMNESKKMMKGNKAKYFCLSLSFIGWALLAAIPSGILEGIVSAMYAPVVVQSLVAVISSLFMVPVYVYVYSTTAGFYEILAGHLIKETEPAPIDPVEIPVEVPDEIPVEVSAEAPVEVKEAVVEPTPVEFEPLTKPANEEKED